MFFYIRDTMVREEQMKDRRNRNAVQAQLKAMQSDSSTGSEQNQQVLSNQSNGPSWTFRRLRLRRNNQPC